MPLFVLFALLAKIGHGGANLHLVLYQGGLETCLIYPVTNRLNIKNNDLRMIRGLALLRLLYFSPLFLTHWCNNMLFPNYKSLEHQWDLIWQRVRLKQLPYLIFLLIMLNQKQYLKSHHLWELS